MPKPAHTRVTVEGHVGPSASGIIERWSFSLNSPDDAAISAASDSVLDAKADAVHTSYQAQIHTPLMPGNVWVDRVVIAAIGADGLYRTRTDGSFIKGEHNESAAGGMADSGMPLQIALCVSLVTTRSGPTGKGRFFLPWPALSLATADRLVPVDQINAAIDNIASFVGGVNDVPGLNVAVVSSKGYSSDVTAVRVGRAADTMRSRREDIDEGYVTATVPQ